MVVDGSALEKDVTWGIEKGRTNFQIVILSLFEVAFAEVSIDNGTRPFVKFSHAASLTPTDAGSCLSSHPRTRPAIPSEDAEAEDQYGSPLMLDIDDSGNSLFENDQKFYPGVAALVKFFGVAGDRQAASITEGILPMELYDRILGFR